MLMIMYIMAGVGLVAAGGVITGLSVLGALVIYRMFTMWRISRSIRKREGGANAPSDTVIPPT